MRCTEPSESRTASWAVTTNRRVPGSSAATTASTAQPLLIASPSFAMLASEPIALIPWTCAPPTSTWPTENWSESLMKSGPVPLNRRMAVPVKSPGKGLAPPRPPARPAPTALARSRSHRVGSSWHLPPGPRVRDRPALRACRRDGTSLERGAHVYGFFSNVTGTSLAANCARAVHLVADAPHEAVDIADREPGSDTDTPGDAVARHIDLVERPQGVDRRAVVRDTREAAYGGRVEQQSGSR